MHQVAAVIGNIIEAVEHVHNTAVSNIAGLVDRVNKVEERLGSDESLISVKVAELDSQASTLKSEAAVKFLEVDGHVKKAADEMQTLQTELRQQFTKT